MEKQIFDAIIHRQIEIIVKFLTRGGNVNIKNADSNTLLHVAVLKKDAHIIKLLIDNGADVNLKNKQENTALDLLLQNTGSFNSKTVFVKMLILAGADVNSKCKNGERTLLHEAAICGDIDLIEILIRRGVDLDAKTPYENYTALHYAASNIHTEDPTIFKILLSANIDINARSEFGETALHVLAETPPKIPSLSLDKIVEVFSEYGADFTAVDDKDYTPILCAMDSSHLQAVKAFIRYYEKEVINYRFPSGETVLHKACFNTHLIIVKFLLKNGANINALDTNNASPLGHAMIAVIYANRTKEDTMEEMRLLEYLLKWNPDVNTVTSDGFNIFCDQDFDLPDFLWKTIMEHLAKLYVIGSPIHLSLFNTISRKSVYKKYFENCCEELENTISSQLHPSSRLTFFNMLTDDKSKLFQYAGNEDLTKSLTKKKVTTKFPIYGTSIYNRFEKAKKKRLIWNKAAEALSDLLPLDIEPNHRVISKILSFYNFKDLRKLF